MTHQASTPRAAMWLLTALGVWLVALGAYFVFVRPALLPEDPRFIGATLARLREAAPGLEAWLRIVFTVMGGVLHSDFRWVLLLPGMIWVVAVALYVRGPDVSGPAASRA